MKNQNQTGLKKVKPNIKLNHNIAKCTSHFSNVIKNYIKCITIHCLPPIANGCLTHIPPRGIENTCNGDDNIR